MDQTVILTELAQVLDALNREEVSRVGDLEIRSVKTDQYYAEIHSVNGKVVRFTFHDKPYNDKQEENLLRIADILKNL